VKPNKSLRGEISESPGRCWSYLAFDMGLSEKIVILALLFGISSPADPQGAEIRVAAAADLKFAMDELGMQFEKQTGTKVNVTYGSSGNFLAQIENGAPFDIFFSADMDYPRRLQAAGLAEPGTLCEYAIGRIVIWTPADASVDVAKEKWAALLKPDVRKIAIANPVHAPYGRAAVAALKSAGIYDQVKSKLVYGENISQAAQFVQSGNAQAGIIALSLAISPGMNAGKSWEIPSEMYLPIEQGAVLLTNGQNKDQARRFLDLTKSAAGLAVLEKFGFAAPAVPASAGKR
jgi:molybdate transport system substrate-binding protein